MHGTEGNRWPVPADKRLRSAFVHELLIVIGIAAAFIAFAIGTILTIMFYVV